MKHFHFYLLLILCSLALACPITEKQAPAPCDEHAECLPGFECEVGNCVACDETCSENLGEGVGVRGAIVCGADNVCLHFPPNALSEPLTIFIEKLSDEPMTPQLKQLSDVYSARPGGLMLESEVLIEIPITSSISPDRVFVYQANHLDGPWEKLTGTSTTVTALGFTNNLSLFIAATERF